LVAAPDRLPSARHKAAQRASEIGGDAQAVAPAAPLIPPGDLSAGAERQPVATASSRSKPTIVGSSVVP